MANVAWKLPDTLALIFLCASVICDRSFCFFFFSFFSLFLWSPEREENVYSIMLRFSDSFYRLLVFPPVCAFRGFEMFRRWNRGFRVYVYTWQKIWVALNVIWHLEKSWLVSKEFLESWRSWQILKIQWASILGEFSIPLISNTEFEKER